jgi:hypothetical protein
MSKPNGPSLQPLTRLEEPYLSQLAAAVYRLQAAAAEERAAELQPALARSRRQDAAARLDTLSAKLASHPGLDLQRHQVNLDSGEVLAAAASAAS